MIFSAKNIVHKVLIENQELKPLTNETLLGLQRVLRGMLTDIINCCDTLGISVALCGGSCLGAVRHNGFIPWDDDMDIAFTREEWEVFKKGFRELLGARYEMGAPGFEDKDCCFPWASIYLKDSEFIWWMNMGMPYPKKIFVDVFVIENVSPNRFVRCIDSLLSPIFKYVATSMLFYKYPNSLMKKIFSSTYKSKCYFLFRQLLGFSFSFVSHKTWVNWFDRFVSRHHTQNSLLTIPNGNRRYKGEMLNRDVFLPYSSGNFEGVKVLLPHNPDEYLKNLYGPDYMIIPPVEKRETHHVVSVKFPHIYNG